MRRLVNRTVGVEVGQHEGLGIRRADELDAAGTESGCRPHYEHIDRISHPGAEAALGFRARTNTDQKPSATMWLSTISTSVNPASVSWAR